MLRHQILGGAEGQRLESRQPHQGKRFDWDYEILKLFPGFRDELKATQVLKSYKNLPRAKQQTSWNTLKDVQIHVTDPCLAWLVAKMVQDAAKNSDGIDLLRQRASQADEVSKRSLNMLNDGMAKFFVGTGLSKSLTHLQNRDCHYNLVLRERFFSKLLAYYGIRRHFRSRTKPE